MARHMIRLRIFSPRRHCAARLREDAVRCQQGARGAWVGDLAWCRARKPRDAVAPRPTFVPCPIPRFSGSARTSAWPTTPPSPPWPGGPCCRSSSWRTAPGRRAARRAGGCTTASARSGGTSPRAARRCCCCAAIRARLIPALAARIGATEVHAGRRTEPAGRRRDARDPCGAGGRRRAAGAAPHRAAARTAPVRTGQRHALCGLHALRPRRLRAAGGPAAAAAGARTR